MARKKLFSERMGHEVRPEAFSAENTNEALRTRLWNAIEDSIKQVKREDNLRRIHFPLIGLKTDISKLCYELVDVFFQERVASTCDEGFSRFMAFLEKRFFELSWDKVYDFIEFLLLRKILHLNVINAILEDERAGYRVIGWQIVPITSEADVSAIEYSLSETKAEALQPVHDHLRKAIEHFSDRENPDYANSIKESISALEALARVLTGNNSAILSDVLNPKKKNNLVERLGLHHALALALSHLYGYASDESGVRHGHKPGRPGPGQAEARLILVIASGLIGYLIDRSRELG